MKALVTGFDAFAGAALNPSGEIATVLSRDPPRDAFDAFEFLVLPTVYAQAAERIGAAIDAGQPDLVLMFGLAGASDAYRLERFALNVADSPEPDNAGDVRSGVAISGSGPAAHATGFDLARIAAACAADDEACRPVVSNHAGAFVCNFVYYSVLQRLAAGGRPAAALFVHVPWSPPARQPADFAKPPAEVHADFARRLLRVLAAEMT